MKSIKVQEMAIGAMRRDGKCTARYCPGHTIPASLKKGDVLTIVGKETSTKMVVEVAEKRVNGGSIEVLFKKTAGVA